MIVTRRILQFDPNDPEADIGTMESIIKPDKGISAELMKISNSVLYGRSGTIKTLKEAIVLLGLKTVKNLVIMLSTLNLSGKLKKPIYRKYLQEFPVISALIAFDLCKPLGLKKLKEEAFLLGLLHRIGMTIIALQKPKQYADLLELSEKEQINLIELERKHYDSDYIDIGIQVFNAWKVPPELLDAISSMNCDIDKIDSQSDLTRILILTDNIAGNLLEIPSYYDGTEKISHIARYYAISPKKIYAFFNNYFEDIKSHPFYQQAVIG